MPGIDKTALEDEGCRGGDAAARAADVEEGRVEAGGHDVDAGICAQRQPYACIDKHDGQKPSCPDVGEEWM